MLWNATIDAAVTTGGLPGAAFVLFVTMGEVEAILNLPVGTAILIEGEVDLPESN